MMKKIKEWVKEHEVTVMLVGAAIAGGVAVIAGQKMIGNVASAGKVVDHVDLDVGKLGNSMLALRMTEIYKSGKKGQCVEAFYLPEKGKSIAEGIGEVASGLATNLAK